MFSLVVEGLSLDVILILARSPGRYDEGSRFGCEARDVLGEGVAAVAASPRLVPCEAHAGLLLYSVMVRRGNLLRRCGDGDDREVRAAGGVAAGEE